MLPVFNNAVDCPTDDRSAIITQACCH